MTEAEARAGALHALAPGYLFHGRYRVTRPLRAGGMGTVYEVTDERTGSRRALKIIRPTLLLEQGDFRARFEREARITGEVESDHIVRVLDAGVDATMGLPFLVMEYLRGADLGALLADQGAFAPADVCTYLAQAAIALDRTHAAGIVHRDLKPENLFLTRRDDGSPCIKVLDFGIATTSDRAAGVETTGVLGSPLYMAPEQLLLDQPTGPAMDVYALGQTTYTLLVGEAYWTPEYERTPSAIALALHLASGIQEPMTERARRRKAALLPASLDRWFSTCVARDPAGRFPSGSAAIAALTALLFPTPGAPAPAPLPTPVPPRARRMTPIPESDASASERARHTPSTVRVVDRTRKGQTVRETPVEATRTNRQATRSGFMVRVDRAQSLVRLEVWGFWTVEQGQAYYEEFVAKTKSLVGTKWFVLARTAELAVQKPEVSELIGRTMEVARKNGCVRAANIVSSTLTKMQLARMSAEQGLAEYGFFQSEDEALAWLLG